MSGKAQRKAYKARRYWIGYEPPCGGFSDGVWMMAWEDGGTWDDGSPVIYAVGMGKCLRRAVVYVRRRNKATKHK